MKKIFGYITLAMALTACGSDEALQEYEQQQDKYPLQFTATVEDIQTRVTADNNWSDGDEIGIQIGTSGDQQGKYTYAANDGTWSSESPVSWQEGQTDVTVTAWYPYGKENADISNQADGYTQYEFLKAEATGQSGQQTVSLVFKHQMAKVMCRVVDAGGRYIRGAKVRFYGMPSVTFDKGAVTATGTRDEITPYSIDEGNFTTYVALLAPQPIASGESFIEVAANGKTYRLKPTDNIELKAGKSYNYKIKIGDKVAYTVDDNGTYHVYTAEGLNAWRTAASASPYSASCTLENSIELTGENNWTPVCQSSYHPYIGTFDGNEKSIIGLKINSNASVVGFIGNLGKDGSGAVKNLTVEAADMSSTGSPANIGAVAGSNNGTISNCHVINTTVSGEHQAGGVVGYNNGIISYCHVSNDCSVKGELDSFLYLGGIASFNSTSGAITACYALCSLGVTDNAKVGGIFGSSDGRCTACYSRCTLSKAPTYAGGISGFNPGTVTASYWANVPGATYEFGKGIGKGTDNTDKVGGTDGKTWNDAVTGMNEALPADAGYKYEIPAGETLPVLVKK